MSAAPEYPMSRESRRFSIRLPRPLWLGLAALLVVLAGAGLRFGGPAYRQHAAIREMELLKGIVETKRGGPTWLREWIGDERMKMLDDVTDVNLALTEVTDDELRAVEVFSNVSSLNLARTKITDAGIEHLRGLGKLERLTLSDTEVTDAGIAKLNGLAHLTHLDLKRTKVTDDGLAYLRGLTELVHLDLSGTKVTEAGIKDTRGALPKLWIETESKFLLRGATGGGFF